MGSTMLLMIAVVSVVLVMEDESLETVLRGQYRQEKIENEDVVCKKVFFILTHYYQATFHYSKLKLKLL